MSWKMVRTTVIVIVTAALLAAWLLWLRISPSSSPDDVTLHGKLLPITALADAQAGNGEKWAAQIQVIRAAAVKPTAGQGDIIYLYVPGYQGSLYEVLEDKQPETIRPIPIDQIRSQVRGMLQQVGLAVTDAEITDPGFSYVGSRPSYTARVYLKSQPGAAAAQIAAPDDPAYAVYVHQERRLGKNVSWTKAIKLVLVK